MKIEDKMNGAANSNISPASAEALDAGAGPGGTERDAASNDSGEDTGGPPQSLVEEIARISRRDTWGDSDAAEAADGGAAKS